jgi:hypothetical protein
MEIESIGSWSDVKHATLNTVHKSPISDAVSRKLKYQLLYAEHSPIRAVSFRWVWKNLKYWVSVHLVRHKFGIDHFVSTQRSDRTGEDRDSKPQDSPVDHMCIANAQAIINISRKRLCNLASSETRQAWDDMLSELFNTEPELVDVSVPECIYRGFCPEPNGCGWDKSKKYELDREMYVGRCMVYKNIKEQQ